MGCCSFIRKAFKKVRKAVKKVVKGVGKVAKKVWKGVKKVASKIGKAVTKMGPLASIALSMMIPGFGLTGIWGAMAKGAITGFITSGGKLKGALVGAAGGAIGYGVTQGVSAFKAGYNGVSEGGSFYSKLEAGFDSVGVSTSDGVAQMYNSAADVLSTGDVSKFNYLDDSGNYVNASKSSTGLFGDAPTPTTSTTSTTAYQDALAEAEYDRVSSTDVGAKVHTRASQAYVNENPAEFGKRMTPTAQGRMMDASLADGEAGAIRQAKAFGYNEQVGKSYYNEYTNGLTDEMGMSVKDQMIEIRDYSKLNKTGLGQGKDLWSQTGGADVDASFDWDRRMATTPPAGITEGTQAHDEWLANETASPTGELYKSNYGLEATTEGGYNVYDPKKLYKEKSWTDKIDGKAVADAFKSNFLTPDTGAGTAQPLMSVSPEAIEPGGGGTGESKRRYGYGTDIYDVTRIGLLSAQQRMTAAQGVV